MAEKLSRAEHLRNLWPILVVLAASILPLALLGDSVSSRIISIVTACLLLWLLEIVPAFVPTLLLWALIPIVLTSLDSNYSLANTLKWAADPVLALFLGGFALGVAAEKHQLDRKLADVAFRRAESMTAMLAVAMGLSALLSMWISNIAAAALMFACVRPLTAPEDQASPLRRALLVGVALGANLGGMATPIGTGPNAIAIASIASSGQVTFLDWMILALPLSLGLLVLGFLLVRWKTRDEKIVLPSDNISVEQSKGWTRRQIGFAGVFCAAVILWLTEPFHGVPASVVALAVAAALFLSGLLGKSDLPRIDWSTLLLIAGGITLGRLIESSGLATSAVERAGLAELHPTITLFILCFASATLSALMSNTATAVLLIPIGLALIPHPSTAILIAISASFGMPFIISTPPNAMAYGEGGLRTADLLYPGLVIMIVGCVVVSLTGQTVLSWVGIP